MPTPGSAPLPARDPLQDLLPSRWLPLLPRLVLAAAMALFAVVILWVTRGQSFLGDEWGFFASYPGFDLELMMEPRVGHLAVGPILFYKGLLELFGPSSIVFRLVLVALLLLCAWLFFELARRRVDEWLAAGGAVLLLAFGSGGEVLSSTLGITMLLTIALGLGALLCLERADRAGDVGACVLLTVAVASFGAVFPFLAGAAVAVLLVNGNARHGAFDWRAAVERLSIGETWRRSWIVLIPLGLYLIWRLWAPPSEGGEVTYENLLRLPNSMLDSLAATLTAMTGLSGPVHADPTLVLESDWGRILIPVLLVGTALLIRHRAGWPLDPWVLVFLAMPLAYWAVVGAVAAPERLPESTRYQLLSAILLMLLYAQLLSGVRVSRFAFLVAGVGLGAAVLTNLANLREFGQFYRANSDENRAELAVLEMARERVDPKLLIELPGGTVGKVPDMVIPAGDYFKAVDDHGSPALPLEDLAAEPAHVRAAADQELIRALGIVVADADGATPMTDTEAKAATGQVGGELQVISAVAAEAAPRDSCLDLEPLAPGAAVALILPRGGFELTAEPGPPPSLALARWGDAPAPPLPAPPPGERQVVRIPPDRVGLPWRLHVLAAAAMTVCPLGASEGSEPG